MDRVFMHLRHVRCPTCSRVFCCARHRMEHERRVHVDAIAAALQPVIKRRFRSAAEQTAQPSDASYNVRLAAVNCRKRLHEEALYAEQQNKWKRMHRPLQLQQQQKRQQQHDQPDAAQRVILKARRSSLSFIKDLRPMAESSPAVPPPIALPPPQPPIALPPPPPPTAPPPPAALLSPPSPPPPAPATAAVELSLPLEQTPPGAGTPVGSSAGSPPSFYQTPMLMTPSPAHGPAAAMAVVATGRATDAASVVDMTPFRDPRDVGDPKPVSLGHNSSQKGFFWSNMARRFRLALRPAKAKPPSTPNTPSPSTIPDISKFYGDIQPRRPISVNDSMTTVYPRPSLDVIRQAHEEAANKTAAE